MCLALMQTAVRGTVYLFMPVRENQDRQRREPEMHDMIAAALCRQTVSLGLTIAVVEDHDDARTSLGLFLKHLGANVVLREMPLKA